MSQYAGEVKTKVNAIGEAYVKYYHGFPASAVRELWKSEQPKWEEAFLRFDEAKPTSADNAASALEPAINALTAMASQERGTSIESIRFLMDDWTGRAKHAFTGYLGELETAVENQLQVAMAIQHFAIVQGALVNAAQERALEIAGQAISALGQATEAAARKRRELLVKAVVEAVKIAGAIINGVATKSSPVEGILSGVGAMVTEAAKPVAGSSPPAIIDSMGGSLIELSSALAKDRTDLRNAMTALRTERLGNADDPNYRLLPPALGELDPGGERVVSYTTR